MTYSIQEVANLFGITTNKIRFYEKKGLISPSREENNTYRYFSEDDVIRIQTILLYRAIGLGISDIEKLLGDSTKAQYLQHFYKQWEVVNDEIHRLSKIRSSLENLMDKMYEVDEASYKGEVLKEIETNMIGEHLKNSWKDKWNFDSWARNYDKDITCSKGQVPIYAHYEALLESVVSEVTRHIQKDDTILDIGIGTGNLANRLYGKGYPIVGVDQSRAMLEVAKTKNKNLKVRLGEFMKLPFESGTFKAIVSTYAFHHLEAEEKCIAVDEMFRVLQPGGMIVIGDLMFESLEAKLEIYKRLTPMQIEEIEDEYYTDIKQLEEYVKKIGRKLDKMQIDMFCWRIVIR